MRLDVPVNDSLRMNKLDPFHDLAENSPDS